METRALTSTALATEVGCVLCKGLNCYLSSFAFHATSLLWPSQLSILQSVAGPYALRALLNLHPSLVIFSRLSRAAANVNALPWAAR